MAVLTAVVVAVAALTGIPWILLAAIPFVLAAVFVLYFFRDPGRTPPEGDNLILSPADGVVTHIEEVEDPPYLGGPAKKVSIFMSLMDVHVNRAPLSGRVEFAEHHAGRFLNAGNPRAMEVNENEVVGFSNGHGRFLVKQIAGVVARRIVCEAKVGEDLVRGERFGMVKFGSRLEVFVPLETAWEVKVGIGQKVRAGLTVIGDLGE